MSQEEKIDFVKLIRRMPWLYAPILNSLNSLASPYNSLLDVACGDGYLLELIHTCNPLCELHGLDIDSFFINEARKKYDFQFELKDIYSLGERYEVVTCNLALHHFDNPVSLIKKLIACSTQVLIISDQLRPITMEELEKRLKRRKLFIGNKDVPFYEKNERDSILEAYSKKEIREFFSEIVKSSIDVKLMFFDEDYYERFVAVIEKK